MSRTQSVPDVRVLPDDEYNRELVANVHPPGRPNPTPAARYDLVVIGAGAAGLVTSAGAAGLGARVALVEEHLLGGDCLNVGCVPSKALIRAARAAAEVKTAGQLGIRVPEGVQVDFPAVMERMRRLRAQISPHDSVRRFEELGVDVFLGTGRFVGEDTVEVDGRRLRFDHAVIATGARPAVPPIPGLVDAGFLTNETVFQLTELPRRLAVLGGGPIGCELAQTFVRLGAQVWLLQSRPQILPREDADAVQIIQAALARDGVRLITTARTTQVRVQGSRKVLCVECPAGRHELEVDEILVAAGRTPNIERLGLETVGVEYDLKRGVMVDDRLRTTHRRILAGGDVCSQFKFTHAADAMARIVIRNALFLGRAKASALVIPWCTYTDPEIAHVGLHEHDARERGIPIQTFLQPLDRVDRAILDGQTEGFVKIHVRKGSDRILGATVVAHHAGEMISEVTLAMVGGLGMKALSTTIHPYPTKGEAIRQAADAYNRSRLTPFVSGVLKRWLAWRRGGP